MDPTARSGLVIARGPRAVEQHVRERLDALAPRSTDALAALRGPVRVLVPSGALRDHLAARLVTTHGARLGVRVQTLDALAHELLARVGRPAPAGALLLDLLVRRAAGAEPTLQALLGRLEDGFAPLVAVVRDLFDAGLDADVLDAFDEAVAALPTTRRRIERLQAIVRIFRSVRATADGRGHFLPGDLYHAAAEVLGELDDPAAVLPTEALVAVGFADVTGRAGELLEAVCRRLPTELVLERPRDIARPEDLGSEDRSARFADRTLERFGGFLAERRTVPAPSPGERTLARAPSREAEVRAVATAVRALLDRGVRPEDVAVVMRDPAPFRVALSTHFGRLAIPFATGRVPGLADAGTGRLGSLLALLERGPDTRVDHWLDVVRSNDPGDEDEAGRLSRPELRLALRVLGLARLEDVRSLDLEATLGGRATLPLPLRRGGEARVEPPDGGDAGAGEAPDEIDTGEVDPGEASGAATATAGGGGASTRRGRRHVSAARLRSARARAESTTAALEAWPRTGDADAHAAALRALVAEELGWEDEGTAGQRLRLALSKLIAETHEEVLEREEFVRLLRRVLEPLMRPGLGPGGGGVRVLEAMEARGRAFAHLFLLGVERGLFPRAGGEDPLLPDGQRASLSAVLPALPVKARRRDEERFLFASLCDAAEAVHLSHATADDEGTALLASPLFLRLLDGDEERVQQLPTPLPTRASEAFRSSPAPPRTAVELATLVALAGSRSDAAARQRVRPAMLAAALAEADVRGDARAALARHRRAVLEEYEGRGDAAARPGPWNGLLGGVGAGHAWPDPWREPQPVTAFERFATCGWQLFLERVLRLEPLPDPMAALPTIDARQLGNTVHRALEAVALGGFPPPLPTGERRAPDALESVLAREGKAPSWPASEAALLALALEAAGRELRESGVPLPGLIRGLAQRALPYLAAARERLDGGPGGVPADATRRVLGAEVAGSVRVELEDEPPLELTFRVDRVDRVESGDGGHLELIDYKTGKPRIDQKTPAKRSEKTLEAIQSGRHLQGFAYARGAEREGGPPVVGRYLFLHEDVEPHAVALDVRTDDEAHGERSAALDDAVGRSATAWRAGIFLPRLHEAGAPDNPKRNAACGWCRVAEACVLGDSAASRRLAEWEAGDGRDEVGTLRIARMAWTMGKDDA